MHISVGTLLSIISQSYHDNEAQRFIKDNHMHFIQYPHSLTVVGCSVTKLCLTLWDPMNWRIPGFTILHYLQEFAQIHVHWVGDAIQPPHLLLPLSPPAFNLSQHQGLHWWSSTFSFSSIWVSSLHQWPKYWSWSFSINTYNKSSGSSSWFDLLALQGTLKSFLQHHN